MGLFNADYLIFFLPEVALTCYR